MSRSLHAARLNAARLTAVATLTLALAACGGGGDAAATAAGDALPKVSAPAGQTWSNTVTASADGFVMGNPNAPIKLVEYGSFTCSHCAEFSGESHAALASEFVDTGRVSFEMRPFVRDRMDLILATVATCAGPERFFPLAQDMFANQPAIFEAANAAPNALQNVMALPEADRFPALAHALQLDQFFAARGIPAAELNRCLSNSAGLEARTTATQTAAERYEINGTPTFLINGAVAENIGTWTQVRDRLRAIGAR